MLQKGEDIRLARLLEVVNSLNLRFPIAVIARETKVDKGNVSAILKGKKPISDNFLKKFDKAFNVNVSGQLLQQSGNAERTITPGMEYLTITPSRSGQISTLPEKDRIIVALQDENRRIQEQLRRLEKQNEKLLELLGNSMQKG